jgi:hypothetical protein
MPAPTRWRTGYSVSPDWTPRTAESIRKEHERIYQYLSQVATDLYNITIVVNGIPGGDVAGPASSLDGQIALFDGLTGKLLKVATGTGIVTATGGVYNTSTLSALLDTLLGSAQGTVVYRDAAAWAGLAPGTAGQVLSTQGAAANPQWVNQSGGTAYEPLTDGDLTDPQLVFADGDCVMVEMM